MVHLGRVGACGKDVGGMGGDEMKAAVKMQAEPSGEIILARKHPRHGWDQWSAKCYVCGQSVRPNSYYGNPGAAANGLQAHLRRAHDITDAVIAGWNDDK